MDKNKSPEEVMNDKYNAMMRELCMRKDEIVGGRLSCLYDISINITFPSLDDPQIIITREIIAASNVY
nr:MAG TPA: hypothetical protein [Caudoviricetes sp.]